MERSKTFLKTAEAIKKIAREKKLLKKEEENLDQYLHWLDRKFGGKRPIDISTSPEKLKERAEWTYDIFSRIRARIIALLQKDYDRIKKIPYYIGYKFTSILGLDTSIKRMRNIQTEIRDELREVLEYWEYVKEHGKLPKWSIWSKELRRLSKYNKHKIIYPLSKIRKDEIEMLAVADMMIRTVKHSA